MGFSKSFFSPLSAMLFALRGVLAGLCLLANARASTPCHVKAAQAYVKAIVSHSPQDAAAVPLEESVVRYEGPPGFHVQSANGASDLRKSLVSGPSAFTVYKSYNEQYNTINSTTVEAIYGIDVGLLQGTLPLTTAKVEEYFTYNGPSDCKIQRIDASFFVGQK